VLKQGTVKLKLAVMPGNISIEDETGVLTEREGIVKGGKKVRFYRPEFPSDFVCGVDKE